MCACRVICGVDRSRKGIPLRTSCCQRLFVKSARNVDEDPTSHEVEDIRHISAGARRSWRAIALLQRSPGVDLLGVPARVRQKVAQGCRVIWPEDDRRLEVLLRHRPDKLAATAARRNYVQDSVGGVPPHGNHPDNGRRRCRYELAQCAGLDPVPWTPRKRGCSSWDVHVGGSLLSTKTKP